MTIKECKEWLSRARKTDEEIDALILEQERALTNATSTVAQSGSEKVHRKTYDSYRIEKCPEYVPDKKG